MILTVEFAKLPMSRSGVVACPVVDLTVNGDDEAPLRCMIDTRAGGVRLPGSSAEALGVDLSDVEPGPRHIIGGTETFLYNADVTLACADFEWQAIVSFCTPDLAGFGLAGLRGFFDKIYVALTATCRWLSLNRTTTGSRDSDWTALADRTADVVARSS
jgi:hypothetical protein